MKTYSIIVTIVAVLALIAAGYFFWQSSRVAGLASQLETCQKDKASIESELGWTNSQLDKIEQTVAVFKAANDSFMIPGDLKASVVGSQEAVIVDQKINNISDSKDRMMLEGDWDDFKSSLRLNALFGFFRKLTENMDRVLQQAMAGSPTGQQ